MSYRLGVDLGTTFTAAAVTSTAGPRCSGSATARCGAVGGVRGDDGDIMVGEAAERGARPTRTGWCGSSSGGSATRSRSSSAARRTRPGADGPAAGLGGRHRHRAAGRPAGRTCASPIRPTGARTSATCWARRSSWPTCAAPRHLHRAARRRRSQYASRDRVRRGDRVAVYDLGGGTFDAAVLRQARTRGSGWLGAPEGVEHLGGIDFDEAVFQHVLAALGDDAADARRPRPGHGRPWPGCGATASRPRRRCRATPTPSVPVALPGMHTGRCG